MVIYTSTINSQDTDMPLSLEPMSKTEVWRGRIYIRKRTEIDKKKGQRNEKKKKKGKK